jgi:DNA-binding NarL/FixJ family response regulator
MQVLDGISEGWSDPEIAKHIEIGVDTVKTHARAIFRKLGANGRTNAVLIACRAGLL